MDYGLRTLNKDGSRSIHGKLQHRWFKGLRLKLQKNVIITFIDKLRKNVLY